MSHKDKRIPQFATSHRQEKYVKSPVSSFGIRPSWRFSTVDKGGIFVWPKGTPTELEIVSKLHDFDSMKWCEIEGHGHHFLSSESLSDEAVRRLQDIHRDDDIESIFSFRLQGEVRVICIRDGNIANLLWYDPDHRVCKSHR
jgi:hypothetical protein